MTTQHKAPRFSLGAVIAAQGQMDLPGGAAARDIDYSLELVDRATRAAKEQGAPVQGFIVPWDAPVTQTRGVSLATSTTGGVFNFTSPGSFIDMLRVRTSVVRAGARMISNIPFFAAGLPKQTASGTGTWRGEDPGSDLSRSTWTTGSASLAFKTVQAASAVSRQTLFSGASGDYEMDQLIQEDLAKVLALAIDLGALNGSGSSNQPLGILQDTSVGTYALGTNGATLAQLDCATMEYNIANANGDAGTLSFVTAPAVRRKARQTAVLGGTAGSLPLWSDNEVMMNRRAIVSTQVPSNLTKGTSTTVCSALVFGDFQYLLVGMFGPGFDVVVDPYVLKLQNMLDISMSAYCDVKVAQAAAFQVAKDILTT